MKLFYTKSSPYANCVRMLITEIGIQDSIEMVEAHPFNNEDEFLAANPLGKVPCLVDSGESIVDSEVICDYLDANTTGGELFNLIYADWRLKSLYSVCSGLMDTLVSRRIEFMRDKDGIKSEFWWQRYDDSIKRVLSYIQDKLVLVPADFSILHINLMSCLYYLDFRHEDIDWRTQYPQLSEFFDSFKDRPCFSQNQLAD